MQKAAPMTNSDTRPPIEQITDATEFARWYWSVDQLKAKCEALGIPSAGSKAELRDRVGFALRHPGAPLAKLTRPKRPDSALWSKGDLTRDTVITPGVSFGPNLRGFFKSEIGKAFVCHSDFMDWVRGNEGATLGDAIEAWQMLEARNLDPDFRREIAESNNYLRYLRAFRDAYPELSLDDAKTCWDQKKIRPAVGGLVVFEPGDRAYLEDARGVVS